MVVLKDAGGIIISRIEISPGISEVRYRIPGKKYSTGYPKKTVYDSRFYSDEKMGDMAHEAAARGMIQYHSENKIRPVNQQIIINVQVNGVNFVVPIKNGKIPSVYDLPDFFGPS